MTSRIRLFRLHAYSCPRARKGWRIILPVWVPRYERFYDICWDEHRYGFRVDTVALSFVRDRHGVRLGLDWGPVALGQWSPSAAPVPWLT